MITPDSGDEAEGKIKHEVKNESEPPSSRGKRKRDEHYEDEINNGDEKLEYMKQVDKEEKVEVQNVEGQNLEEQNFEKQKLDEQNLEERNLQERNLQKRKLKEQSLEEQILEKQNLGEQKLEEQNFEEQNLEEQNLEEPTLEEPNLEEPNLEELNLEEQNLEEQKPEGHKFSDQIPPTQQIPQPQENADDEIPAITYKIPKKPEESLKPKLDNCLHLFLIDLSKAKKIDSFSFRIYEISFVSVIIRGVVVDIGDHKGQKRVVIDDGTGEAVVYIESKRYIEELKKEFHEAYEEAYTFLRSTTCDDENSDAVNEHSDTVDEHRKYMNSIHKRLARASALTMRGVKIKVDNCPTLDNINIGDVLCVKGTLSHHEDNVFVFVKHVRKVPFDFQEEQRYRENLLDVYEKYFGVVFHPDIDFSHKETWHVENDFE